MLKPGEIFNGLEIFIGGEIAKTIDTWRRRYDPTVLDVNPHITLAYPPFIPFDRWEALKPKVLKCLAGYQPFRIIFREAGTFAGDSPIEPHVLWLKPDDGGIILHIRQDLEKCLPNYVPSMVVPYVPHLSIGFIQGNDALHKALEEVQKNLKPFEVEVNEIVYEGLDKKTEQPFFDHLPLGNLC
jgi:2'-5' RNA ligase